MKPLRPGALAPRPKTGVSVSIGLDLEGGETLITTTPDGKITRHPIKE